MNNVNELAVRMFHKAGKSNVFFSPYSVYIALCMLWEGASDKDKVKASRSLILKNVPIDAKKVVWEVANSLWHDLHCNISPTYLDILGKQYSIEVLQRNFASHKTVEEINRWVSKKTHGKINDIIDGLSSDEKMALINAVYFKGKWLSQFEPHDTKSGTFYCLDGTESAIKTMYQKSKYKYVFYEDVQAIEIPYKGKDISMVIAMPYHKEPLGEGKAKIVGIANVTINEISKNGLSIGAGSTVICDIDSPKTVKSLRQLEKEGLIKIEEINFKEGVSKEESPAFKFFSSATEEKIQNWFQKLDDTRTAEIILRMPKFKMEDTWDLTGLLGEIGFSSLTNTELTGIGNQIYISRILHKSFVEVDEEGTEAAAVTACLMKYMSLDRTPKFIVDRPFLFFIKHNQSNTILFMGKVTEL